MPQRAPVPLMAPVLQGAPEPGAQELLRSWGGGGGKRLPGPGIQGNPYPKLKTPRIWPIIFGRAPSSRAKTSKNKNEPH